MNYPTFASMEADLKDELDLNDETFIQDDEMKRYFNEAVDMIEHQIHTMCEDYFMAYAEIPVVAGDTEIQLPSNIYANKIRKLIWDYSNNEKYEILPIRDLMETPWVNTQDLYRYIFLNNGVTNVNTIGTVLSIYPAFRSTSTTALKMFYIREAADYVDEDSVCDIPEWSNVIIQYVRYKCMIKEGHPNSDQAKVDLDVIIKNMIEALRSRAMDENNKLALDPRVLGDYSLYNNDGWYGW